MSKENVDVLIKMMESLDDKTLWNLLQAAILQATAASDVLRSRGG